MATTGRNDPCPCGSGKKYKHCCGPREHAKQVREVTRHRDDEALWRELLNMLDRPALYVDSQSAFSRFWNGDFDLRVARVLGPAEMEPFLEWYVYDYPTGQGRRRVVELYAAEYGLHMTIAQRELLAELSASYLSLHSIDRVSPDGRIEIKDLLVGGTYQVSDPGLARLAMPGDLLLGRRFGEGERCRLSRGTVLLLGALRAGLVAAADRGYGAYCEEHYQATWPEFLRQAGYVMFHYLATPEAAAGYRRAAGRHGHFDPRPALERLFKARQLLAEERARKQQEAERAEEDDDEEEDEPGPRVERTAGGIFIPGQPKPSPGGILLPGQVRE
ncbi:MAG TPA: SEC-C domain-containing protein [Anaerolineae bacterium]|nr:SEC-C domain-containing protein [Anaerolineae bacterium]HOR00712.1 SEC-C domain-containing protein [Anaerolineae bacterium]HPL28960.1 SEC-C domain-containing protein [Anaerolineae bacterium]